MSARTRAKASPRRKAGSKAPKPKRSIAFRLVVEGQEMLVRCKPDSQLEEMVHFEYRSPHKPPRRIPVSETGYLSDFAFRNVVADEGGPEAYARAFVLHFLDCGKKHAPVRKNRDQLSLF